MLIRLFQPEDSDRIAQLFHDTIRNVNIADYSLAQVKAWAPDDLNFQDWQAECSHKFTYVAEQSGEIVGFAQLEANGHIDCFFCHKDYQRCGVGTRLYRALEAKAISLNLELLFVEVSITAKAFFKSRGFRLVREQQVSCRGEQLTNFVMEKQLPQSAIHTALTTEANASGHNPDPCVVATFYHFTKLDNYREMQPLVAELGDRYGLKGVILLAEEGINSTVAGDRDGIDALLSYLRADPRLQNLEHKESYCQVMPYQTLKVRIRPELVKFGIEHIDPSKEVGIYVEPKEWNQLISDPDVLVIDTRNIYEVEFGTFAGAINPHLEFFHEFPNYVQTALRDRQHQKIAMFCTGGIRCEKASAYMLSLGFEQVYHLKGGILKYLAEVPADESLWQGECFVFDDRIAI
ncbi:MAG: rhodanese-related sulfurtransferase [Pseudanabaenaceae cyanobacterium bins.39]|nr:rhodanese-related sulfurtransferase [Pseudanabaenaceae cyanobacterium bins.39]